MANGNDPANIPYIIAENGFYYVAYKEKVKVPEVVVSSKGVANGLSEEYNDGWDFGPDSYDPNSTASPPYTQTLGIQEATSYIYNEGGGVILVSPGHYIFTGNPEHVITFPVISYSSRPMIIEIRGAFSGMFTVANGQATLPADFGAVFDFTGLTAPATVPGSEFYVPPQTGVPFNINNLVLIMKNIEIINSINSNYTGIDAFYASSFGIEDATVTVNSYAGAISAPTGTAIGIRFPVSFNNNLVYGTNFFVQGYAIGIQAEGNTTLTNFYIQSCGDGLQTTAGGNSSSTYALTLTHANIQECTYSITNRDAADTPFVLIGTYVTFENSGTVPLMTTTYNVLDVNGNLRGHLYYTMNDSTSTDNPITFSGTTYFWMRRLSGPVLPIPTTLAITSGTQFTNNYGVPIVVNVPITFNPTSTAAATVTIGKQPGTVSTTFLSDSEPEALTVGRIRTYSIDLPAGWSMLITTVNATIGTAYITEPE